MLQMNIHGGKIIAAKECSLTLALLSWIDLLGLLATNDNRRLKVPMKADIKGKANDKVVKEEYLSAVLVKYTLIQCRYVLGFMREYEVVPKNDVSIIVSGTAEKPTRISIRARFAQDSDSCEVV
jgi:hypothetical protein